MSLWSAQSWRAAYNAAKEGKAGEAVAMGTVAALPVAMPLGIKAYQGAMAAHNTFNPTGAEMADIGRIAQSAIKSEAKSIIADIISGNPTERIKQGFSNI